MKKLDFKIDGKIIAEELKQVELSRETGNMYIPVYTESKVREAVQKNIFDTDKYNLPEDKKVDKIMLSLTDRVSLRNNFGKNKDVRFEDLVKNNTFFALRAVFNDAIKREKFQESVEVDEVNPQTHEKTGKKIVQTHDMIRGKRFYDDLIKNNGLSSEFFKKAKIGIFAGRNKLDGKRLKTSIKYDEFEQTTIYVSETFIDKDTGEEVMDTGHVTIYHGATVNGKTNVVYIIEWQSRNENNGIEILTEEEYKARFESHKATRGNLDKNHMTTMKQITTEKEYLEVAKSWRKSKGKQ